jgi:DNA ligase-1
MRELRDGETVEVQGSAKRPYRVQNLAGIYACSCPAWRHQSLPIDRRTCKHVRQVRGDLAEQSRLGTPLPVRPVHVAAPKAPPLLLAETWKDNVDPTGWWLSEKLDGVRAYWDGKQFLSRQGNPFFAPYWFTEGLPLEPLDGELWIGRKMFQRTVSIVRRHDESQLWKEVRFLMFDAPAHNGPFEERMKLLKLVMEISRPAFAFMHNHERCQGRDDLHKRLAQIEIIGGEGLMLRQPGSVYEAGRSGTLLKVKTFKDAEARVMGHEPGSGRHQGRLGALLVELANGIRFCVGSGLSDADRINPPAIGSVIAFKYQELSNTGVPRFPIYLGAGSNLSLFEGEQPMNQGQTSKRRFEFVEGTSSKFWEIQVDGGDVQVQFGRIATAGQSTAKSFPDQETAEKHAAKVIREKVAKGYREVAA